MKVFCFVHANKIDRAECEGRYNRLGLAGWGAVMDAVEGITSLKSLNKFDGYAAIRTGGVKEADLHSKELGVAVARFLPRSAETLLELDLR